MDASHDPNFWVEFRGWLHLVWGSLAALAGWAYSSTQKRLSDVEQKCTQVAEGNQRSLNDHMIDAARQYQSRSETQEMVDRTVGPLKTQMDRLEHKLDRVLEQMAGSPAVRSPRGGS